MTNFNRAEMLREQLVSDGYVAMRSCECLNGGNIHRYILVRSFKDGEGSPCYLDDYCIIHSEKFLEILEGFLNGTGDEIIVPDNPFALVISNGSDSSEEIEL